MVVPTVIDTLSPPYATFPAFIQLLLSSPYGTLLPKELYQCLTISCFRCKTPVLLCQQHLQQPWLRPWSWSGQDHLPNLEVECCINTAIGVASRYVRPAWSASRGHQSLSLLNPLRIKSWESGFSRRQYKSRSMNLSCVLPRSPTRLFSSRVSASFCKTWPPSVVVMSQIKMNILAIIIFTFVVLYFHVRLAIRSLGRARETPVFGFEISLAVIGRFVHSYLTYSSRFILS